MNGIAHVSIVGTVTRDPEIKDVASTKLATFSLAVNRKVKGEKVASFFDCKAWGKTAETIVEYVKKGKPIYVQGELIQERWEKDGENRSKIVVNVNSFQFLPGGEKEDAKPKGPPDPVHYEPVGQEDIPF